MVACAAVALAACGLSTQLATPIISPSVLVNRDAAITRTLDVPALLADRRDPGTVYLSGVELQDGTCRFYTSGDAGLTWTRGTAPSLPPYTNCGAGGTHPLGFRTTMAQASDGTLLLAYAANDPASGGSRSVLLGRSTDGGHSWRTVAVDAAPAATGPGTAELDFEPHVAVDPADAQRVYVIWCRSYPFANGRVLHPTRAWMATSTDGGATFTRPVMVFDRGIGSDPPYPVVVNGTLYASWLETFPRPAGGGSSPPDKAWVSSSTDGGRTWKDNPVSQAPNGDTPILLYDSVHSRFDTFWDDGRNRGLDIFFSSSPDATAWSPAKRLNDDAANTGRDHLLPAASIAPDGRVDVAWYDYRNDPYPPPTNGDLGHRNDVYSTSSFDGGTTWTANVRVNDLLIDRTKGVDNSSYFLEEPPAIASTDSWAVAAWTDTRNGDASTSSQDLYAATLAFDRSAIPAGMAGAAAAGYSRSDLVLVAVVVGLAALLAGAGLALLLVALRARRRAPLDTPAP